MVHPFYAVALFDLGGLARMTRVDASDLFTPRTLAVDADVPRGSGSTERFLLIDGKSVVPTARAGQGSLLFSVNLFVRCANPPLVR